MNQPSLAPTNAVTRLRKSGLSRQGIANEVGCTRQAVGLWEQGKRSPRGTHMASLVKLAESRGITLLASDFAAANGEQ